MEETTTQTPVAAATAAPAAPVADASDAEKNKTIAALAYIIFFLPMVTDAKDSKFAMFHANQGLLVLLLSIAAWVVALVPVLGWIASPIISIVALVFFVMGILNAVNGKMKPLPLIGNYHLLDK